MHLQIKVVNAYGYTQGDEPTLRSALTGFRTAANMQEFQNLIINHNPFETDKHLTNEEIYKIIMSGQEKGTQTDNEADLNLSLDYTYSPAAVGYTMGLKIFTFKNMFDALSIAELAGHYAHEYCHTLGFRDPDDLSNVSNNVPYEIGRIISELVNLEEMNIQLA